MAVVRVIKSKRMDWVIFVYNGSHRYFDFGFEARVYDVRIQFFFHAAPRDITPILTFQIELSIEYHYFRMYIDIVI